jgi:peptidyl-prolyl cis-trans isomerase SurA
MKRLLVLLIFTFNLIVIFAQNNIPVDGIIVIVGKEIVMKSDLENAYFEYTSQNGTEGNEEEIKCDILKKIVLQKLMIHQASLDSIDVTDQQVDDQINYRVAYLIQQVGGDPKVIEEYYKKSLADIKKDMRSMTREYLLVEQVQNKITNAVSVTPSEVKAFFDRMSYDSLPTVQATYEFGHIVKFPPVSEEEIAAIKLKLNGFRDRVLAGEKFSMLARLYSDDPGTAAKGGNLGFVERGTLYPEFEAVAFKLKTGEISQVVQTKAGYHIIQLIERRGESINVAHILLQPKPSLDEQVKAIEFLDSIRSVILAQHLDFSKAALLYSDDPNKNSGGWLVNSYTNSNKFDKESIDQATFATLDKLTPEKYSEAVPFVNEDGMMGYRIIYLKSKVPAHKPNLMEDYDMIKNAALEEKKYNAIEKWIINKVKVTSIKVVEEYKNCSFVNEWQIP